MLSTRRSLSALIALAVTACAYVGSAVATVTSRVRDFVLAVPAAFTDPEPPRKPLPGPAVALIRAREYFRKQVERERAQVRPDWRMCPST